MVLHPNVSVVRHLAQMVDAPSAQAVPRPFAQMDPSPKVRTPVVRWEEFPGNLATVGLGRVVGALLVWVPREEELVWVVHKVAQAASSVLVVHHHPAPLGC